MKIEDLSKSQIDAQIKQLIEKADNFWIKTFGKEEATDVDKLRLLSRQGKIQNKIQHDLMTYYFKKQGLYTDGKTTLQERADKLILMKTEFGKKTAKVRDNTIQDIDALINRAKQKKDELEKIPSILKEEYKIDRNKILNNLKGELQSFYDSYQDYIEKEIKIVFNDFLTTVKTRQDDAIERARAKITDLQHRQKEKITSGVQKYSGELEAELTILKYKEGDNALIEKYNEEIRKINQELNELNDPIIPVEKEPIKEEIIKEPLTIPVIIEESYPTNDMLETVEEEIITAPEKEENLALSNLTVRKLKEIADQHKIKYDTKIRKSDLIELIDGV